MKKGKRKYDTEKYPRIVSRLFDAIGDIDDAYIAAAEKRKRKPYVTKIAALIAAAFVVILAVFVSAPAITNFENKIADGHPAQCPELIKENSDPTKSPDEILLGASRGAELRVSPDEDLFEKPRIIWKDAENRMYSVALSREEVKKFRELSGYGQPCADDLRAFDLWITDTDGTVVSPYLKRSPGNIYFETLFDYYPEIYPSSEFVAYLKNVVTNENAAKRSVK